MICYKYEEVFFNFSSKFLMLEKYNASCKYTGMNYK